MRKHFLPAHPRSRGENCTADAKPPHSGGSSPLTRGKPLRPRLVVWENGLIPAHAGKTPTQKDNDNEYPAHPRSRGENFS